nr:MAG TPA: hypothetical protein [Caudoviricetes sp.]
MIAAVIHPPPLDPVVLESKKLKADPYSDDGPTILADIRDTLMLDPVFPKTKYVCPA